MIRIKVVKLNPDAVVPSLAKKGDAGLDLVATSCKVGEEGYLEYGTGLSMEIPEGYRGVIVPRSSISKKDLAIANSPGTIDSGYRGEVKVRFKPVSRFKKEGNESELSSEPNVYLVGDRIAQFYLEKNIEIEFDEVSQLNDTERGSGGFGSSGN